MEQFTNLLNGKISRKGSPFKVLSPIDQKVLGEGRLISKEDIDKIFEQSRTQDKNTIRLSGLEGLGRYLEQKKEEFTKQIILETGYTLQDSSDIVNGSIELVTYFSRHLHDTSEVLPESRFSYSNPIPRRLKLVSKPYGIVAAMTPQNAPLILEITVILNALATGNSVIIRPSSQCVGTATLLIKGLVETLPSNLLSHVSIISCKATDFLDSSYKVADLIHYIGSSYHGRRILSDSLSHNIKALVDGEGNSMVVIDKTATLEDAVKACRNGIIRCNGELCSTIRTIVVDFERYEEFVSSLICELKSVEVGDPRSDTVDMGPLFHEDQIKKLYEASKKYSILSGKLVLHPMGSNYFTPLICQLDTDDIGFLQEQVFGPIAGVVAYKGNEWKKWLTESPFRLNDAVFSNDKYFIKEFIATSRAPRIVINNDPSIESVFEPWGGFLPSGSDDVSFWKYKYLKSIQIDTNL